MPSTMAPRFISGSTYCILFFSLPSMLIENKYKPSIRAEVIGNQMMRYFVFAKTILKYVIWLKPTQHIMKKTNFYIYLCKFGHTSKIKIYNVMPYLFFGFVENIYFNASIC